MGNDMKRMNIDKLERICFVCESKMKEEMRELEITRDGYTLKLNGVKAYVCPKCGQIIYNSNDLKMMEKLCMAMSQTKNQESEINLNVSELAETLRVSNQTIYNMIKDGRLKPIKIGKEWRFMKKDIQSILGEENELMAARGFKNSNNEDEDIMNAFFEEKENDHK